MNYIVGNKCPKFNFCSDDSNIVNIYWYITHTKVLTNHNKYAFEGTDGTLFVFND